VFHQWRLPVAGTVNFLHCQAYTIVLKRFGLLKSADMDDEIKEFFLFVPAELTD